MIWLEVADLVIIASRTLKLDTDRVLALLDPIAAEAALGQARSGAEDDEPATQAARLLHALVDQRPLRRGNQQVALAAMLQLLALNGWEVDPDPAEATRAVVAELAAGTLDTSGVAVWLAPRLRPLGHAVTCAKEASMRRWRPLVAVSMGMATMRRQPKGMFQRFTDRARRAVHLAQEEARLLRHNYVGTEHLLLGLLYEGEGVAAKTLGSLGISLEAVRTQVEQTIGRGPTPPQGTSRSRHAPRRCWSCRCGRRCSSATTTSAPNTSCWACSARARASPPKCWPDSARTTPACGRRCWSC